VLYRGHFRNFPRTTRQRAATTFAPALRRIGRVSQGELCPCASLTGGEESRAVTLNHGSTGPFVDLSGKVFWSHSSDPFALLRSEFGQ